MENVFILLIVISLVTLVGHGIWMGAAWLLRKSTGDSMDDLPEWRRCGFCRRTTLERGDKCPHCGEDMRGSLARDLSALAELESWLENWERGTPPKPQQVAKKIQAVRSLLDRHRDSLVSSRDATLPPTPAPQAAEKPKAPTSPVVVERPTPVRPREPEPVRPSPVFAATVVPEKPRRPIREVPSASSESHSEIPALPKAVPPAVVEPSPEPEPHRSLGEMLAEFMEPHNIRWGEVIGGLLFIIGATALVITQWETLQQFRTFRLFLLGGISTAVFGLGLYAHDRWKLEATSRVLLTMATLLVPLNFLLLAGNFGLSHDDSLAVTIALPAVLSSVFGALLFLTGRVLVPGGRWWMLLSVLGNSALTLVLARRFDPGMPGWRFAALGCLPSLVFAGSMAGFLYGRFRRARLSPVRTVALFNLLGTGTFVWAVAAGLLAFEGFRAAAIPAVLGRLAIPLSLAAMPIVAAGLIVMRRTRPTGSGEVFRTAGIWIALVGALAMMAAVGMAWPQPRLILVVGLINGLALAAAALAFEMPLLHAGTVLCSGLTWLTGYHLLAGHLAAIPGRSLSMTMIRHFTSADSGLALVVLALLAAAASELLARRNRLGDGLAYAWGCGTIAMVSLSLVTVHAGFVSHAVSSDAAIVYGICGLGVLVVNLRLRQVSLAYVGLGLLLCTTAWTLWRQSNHVSPAWATVASIEALLLSFLALFLQKRVGGVNPQLTQSCVSTSISSRLSPIFDLYRLPCCHMAELLAAIALALGVATAWLDRDLIVNSSLPPITTACVAAAYLLLAWIWQSSERTSVASAVVLAGLIHALVFNFTGMVPRPWAFALLSHATLAGMAAILLKQFGHHVLELASGEERLGRIFTAPLSQSALATSLLALLAMAAPSPAGYWLWLSAIWLAMAISSRWPPLLAAHQAALAMAVGRGIGVWLLQHGTTSLSTTTAMLTIQVGLAILVLGWVVVRIVLRGNPTAWKLLNPGWPMVDVAMKHGLVVVQAFSLMGPLSLGVGAELSPLGSASATASLASSVDSAAFGSPAWWLAGVLAIAAMVSLWERWRRAEILDAMILTLTVPCLIAGASIPQTAVASTLRWGLAAGFLILAAPIWGRRWLGDQAKRVGARIRVGSDGPQAARAATILLAAVPVLVLTMVAAWQQIAGPGIGQPTEGIFSRMPAAVSYIVPLVLILIGLVGHALRERSAGYAFSGGLVSLLSVGLGYPLYLKTVGRPMHAAELVTLVELCTITAAVWGIAWMAARRWLDIWRETGEEPSARLLMNVQLGMAVLGNVLFMAIALLLLVFEKGLGSEWIRAAGSPLGWLAFLLTTGAIVYRGLELRRHASPDLAGLLGMTAIGLLACTVFGRWPEWGYRTLMLGWASYSLLVALGAWRVAVVRAAAGADGPPLALVRLASVWVRVAGIAAVLLGLKAALVYEEQLWAAGAIATASLAGAVMAIWRRREGWAFTAALGVNLAASLVVSHYYRFDFMDWWIAMVQANVIASSATAMVWLALRRRLIQGSPSGKNRDLLLRVQLVLPVMGCVEMGLMFLAGAISTSVRSHEELADLANKPGWLAVLLTALATAWYFVQVSPWRLFHVVGGLALGLVLLVAGSQPWKPDGDVCRHTLMAGMACACVVVLVLGWLGRRLRLKPSLETCDESHTQLVAERRTVCEWSTAIGILAVGLALLWASVGSYRPWWSAGTILAVSAAAGMLAMWQRLPVYVYLSGLLVNVAATVAWVTWGPDTWTACLKVQSLGLAIGSIAWSLVELIGRREVSSIDVEDRRLPFAHLGGMGAVAAMVPVVIAAVLEGLLGMPRNHDVVCMSDRLSWVTFAALAIAMTIALWDRTARFPLAGLYATGLMATTAAICTVAPTPLFLYWLGGLMLGAFVLVTAVLARLLPHLAPWVRKIGIVHAPGRWPSSWFPVVQGALGVIGGLLATWIAIDPRFQAGIPHAVAGLLHLPWLAAYAAQFRMAGPAIAAMLAAASLLMAGYGEDVWRKAWQQATFGAGALTLAAAGWAWLPADIAIPWAHRTVILFVAATAATVAAMGIMSWRILVESTWRPAARRAAGWLAILAAGALPAVLVQEIVLYDAVNGVPMAWPAVAVVAAALVLLAAACIVFAVMRGPDPLRLSGRWRTSYVYAAEILLVIVGVHLRLTVPWLFRMGLIEKYGMFIAMAVAFVGAGLSEWFRRRGLQVLAEPLERTAVLLPVLPMVMFWLIGPRTPAVWFLIGLFYATQAWMRQSFWLACLAAVTGNMGLWVLWDRWNLGILEHPQLWLLPLALMALVAEYINHGRLKWQQSAAIRYFMLSVIYVSSSADMFLAGIGNSVVLPLVLLGLSMLGILAGMALRIRSFLHLGAVFLLVVLVTMLKYVTIDLHQTWVFWVCVILTGAATIAFFAVFEKRRNDILAAMRRFKTWEK